MAFSIGYGSVFARMLSEQKLFVEINEKAETASIDLEGKLLVLPSWDGSEELQRFLMSHEVAHAAYTPARDWVDTIKAKPKEEQLMFKTCLNIIEDCRIDRLLQERYPVIRKWYRKGWEELLQIRPDFLGKKDEIQGLQFFNRINSYFKTKSAGMPDYFDLTWTSEEQNFIDRVDSAQTFEEVKQLAEELFQMIPPEERKTQIIKINLSMFDVRDLDWQIEQALKKGKDPNSINMRRPEPTVGDYVYLQDDDWKPFVVEHLPSSMGSITSNRDVITKLVSEFNRKATSLQFANIQASATGELDMARLHAFKTEDDLFLTKFEAKKLAKNHGMIMIIDSSGSMQDVFESVIEQVYSLALFCKRTGVPFEAYAFNDKYGRTSPMTKSRFSFLKIFDSSQSLSKLTELAAKWKEFTAWSGTPLSDSIHLAKTMVLDFKKKHNIEVMNVVFLTDGECTNSVYGSTYVDVKSRMVVPAKANFNGRQDGTAALFTILRERTQSNVFTFYLGSNTFKFEKGAGGLNGVFYIPQTNVSRSDSRMFIKLFTDNISKVTN